MGLVTYPANDLSRRFPPTPGPSEAEARVLDAALRLAPAMGWTWRDGLRGRRRRASRRARPSCCCRQARATSRRCCSRACDRAALAALADVDPGALKVRERIRRGALARLDAALAHEAATRRWAGFLALPTNAALALRLAWESADVIWRWAGDTATDENHYTKRALLAGILAATLWCG